MRLRTAPLVLTVALVGLTARASVAQTMVTYHLHNEFSPINGVKQLKTANPDVGAVVLRSPDLKNSSGNFFKMLGSFETQTGDPNVSGIIPAGSIVTFSVWLRKTTVEGTFHPSAALFFNQYWGSVPGLCGAGSGPGGPLPQLTTTLTKYTFSCTIPEARTMASSDRFYVEVGAWVDVSPGKRSVQLELHIEGTPGGNYDSTVIIPLPQRPTITSLAPASGIVGSAVTVQGTGFGAVQGNSTITFNGTTAGVTSWSNTAVVATVPGGATTGPVVIAVNGQPSNPVPFTVIPPPAITSITPVSAVRGQLVTIGGTGFQAAQGSSTVTFDGVAAAVSSWSDTSIAAAVPAGATGGPVVVTVGGQASNGVPFTVIPPPVISSVSPATGVRGQVVTAAGSNFGATQATSTISFNGVLASTTSWSDSAISAIVPANATSGPVVVTVNSQASNDVSFTVIPPPVINSLDPAIGIVAQVVSIAGTGFGTAQGASSVTFNGVAAPVSMWSDTSISASVPSGATTGPVIVSVNGQQSQGVTFTVVPAPAIASLDPSGGLAGQSVTIHGSSFGASQGSSVVSFNGTGAAVTGWSDTVIHATVPAGVTTGPVVVTVGGQASNGVTFTVISGPEVSSITPTMGMVGQPVSITGARFGAAQGASTVTFNGAIAAATAWSDTSIETTVPPGASSGPVRVTVNGQTSNSTAFTVIPSTFQLTAFTPADGSVGVLTTPVTATFSGPVDPASLTSLTVQLLDAANAQIGATLAYDDATRTVRLTPAAPLIPMEVYAVQAAGGAAGVRGMDGTALAADVRWTFRAAAGPLVPSAAYHFSELEGSTTADASGNGNTAILMNAGWSTAGRSGGGLSFVPSAAQWVDVPESETLRLLENFTLSLWVRPTATGAPQELIGRHDALGNNVSLRLDANLLPSFAGTFTSGEQSVAAPLAIPADVWTHLAVTFDGEQVTVWVNGIAAAIAEATGGLTPTTSAWRIGGVDGSPFVGILDEVRIYRLALMQEELAFDMATTTDAATVTSVSPSSVVVGDTIVITGTNFGPTQGMSKVTIGGETAQVTSWSDTRIEAIVPSFSGSAAVVVTVNGEEATDVDPDPDPITVRPRPSISSLDPRAAFVGQKVRLNGSNFGASPGTVTFNGVTATPISWTDTCIEVTVPEGATTGPVAVTVNGLTSNSVTFSIAGTTSTGGRSTVTVWHSEGGVNADIGTWDGSPEVDGCTFFYVDIDVTPGGGSLTFTYNQRKQYVPVNDWLDVYILTPGTTWDPGDIWSQDGSIRCQTQNYPAGVVPVIEDFIWQYQPGETPDYYFDQPLDEWQGQRIRVVFRQWFDGYPGDDTQTRIRDLKFNPARFQIERPVESAMFPLSQNNYRETEPIEFRVGAGAQTGAVNWTAALEYQTSGNRGRTTPPADTFQTQANQTITRTYEARGGKITLRATSTMNGAPVEAGPLTFFVVGESIPDAVITARLSSLYSGATANLLTGIASRESTYRQFATSSLFGKQARWPTESYDGGSHIGLMMVPVTFADAWDWLVNTETGAAMFQDKLATAGRVEARIRARNPGLRALTPTELENMALVLYGPYANASNDRQYYIPAATAAGLDWAINTIGNAQGVRYADSVRAQIR